MAYKAYISAHAYGQAIALHHVDVSYYDEGLCEDFEEHMGLVFLPEQTFASDQVDSEMLVFEVVDVHKYALAKIKYGI